MTEKIKQRKLGTSDISITPIGLGAWQFSEGKSFTGLFWDPLSVEQTNSIIEKAIAEGINWFDTAEMYGGGKSERGLSAGLQEAGVKDDDIRIATKWWPLFRFARNIRKTIDTRLDNLSPYSIDLYQIHQPYSFSFTRSEMNAMADIADQGHIRTIGVSNFSADKMRTAFEELEKRDYPLVSNQVKYSLLERDIESNGILDTAKELGITIIAYSPLEQGLLTGKFHDQPELLDNRPFIRKRLLKRRINESEKLVVLLQQIAEEIDATASEVALNWLINYHDNVVAIPGASKDYHVEQNANAMRFELSSEQMSAIATASEQFI